MLKRYMVVYDGISRMLAKKGTNFLIMRLFCSSKTFAAIWLLQVVMVRFFLYSSPLHACIHIQWSPWQCNCKSKIHLYCTRFLVHVKHVSKGCHPERKVQFFLTLFKRPLTPPPPFIWTFVLFCGGCFLKRVWTMFENLI